MKYMYCCAFGRIDNNERKFALTTRKADILHWHKTKKPDMWQKYYRLPVSFYNSIRPWDGPTFIVQSEAINERGEVIPQ